MNANIYLNWQITSRWALIAGIEATHYSNGNSNYPNAGVNTAGGRIGLVRTFGAEESKKKSSHIGKSAIFQLRPYRIRGDPAQRHHLAR